MDPKTITPYSCLLSVYGKEKPENLFVALESIFAQTLPPDEFVIVRDGPLSSELNDVIARFENAHPGVIVYVDNESNMGLAHSLSRGLEACTYELVMRMDSDDYSLPDRAARQIAYMDEHPHCCCCGTLVYEFLEDVDNIVSLVELPETHEEISRFAKKRMPLRHPAMMFRKSVVLSSGGYGDLLYFEDYELVSRLLMSGYELHNVQEPLVRVRVSDSFFGRRGGIEYARYMRDCFKLLRDRNQISRLQYALSTTSRTIVCYAPNPARMFFYRHFLRKKATEPKPFRKGETHL